MDESAGKVLAIIAVTVTVWVVTMLLFVGFLDDFLFGGVSVQNMIFTLLVIVIVPMAIFVLSLFLIIRAKSDARNGRKDVTVNTVTRRCASCGSTIDASARSCPRCFTPQPPPGSRKR